MLINDCSAISKLMNITNQFQEAGLKFTNAAVEKDKYPF